MSRISLTTWLTLLLLGGIAAGVWAQHDPMSDDPGDLRFLLLLALIRLLAVQIFQQAGADNPAPLTDRFGRLTRALLHPLTLALAFIAIICYRISTLHGMVCDEGIWNYVAHSWLRFGLRPYIDTVENKTPGIYYLFAASNLLFGVNYWFPRALGILTIALTGFGIFAIGVKLHSRLLGLLALLFFYLTGISDIMDARLPAQTEIFMVGASVLAAWLVVDAAARPRGLQLRRLALAGGALGLAIAFKQVAIFTVPGLCCLYLALTAGRGRTLNSTMPELLAIGGGIIAVTALSLVPLLLGGIGMRDYLHGAWLILLAPGSSVPNAKLHFQHAMMVLSSPDLQIYLPTLLLALLLYRQMRTARIPLWGLLGWLAFDFLAVNASGTYYAHQLRQLGPELALLAGAGLTILWEQPPVRAQLTPLRLAWLLLVVALLWWPSWRPYRNPIATAKTREVGRYLREHTRPDAYVYVFGITAENPILAYAERRAPTRYFNQFFFRMPGVETQVQRDFAARPPVYLALPFDHKMSLQPTREIPKWVDRLVARSYSLETTISYPLISEFDEQYTGGYYLYRRN